MLESSRNETARWEEVRSRSHWEAFRDCRLQALRDSLGFLPRPRSRTPRITGTIDGDGYAIDNIVFESRPGLVVTANVYRPRARRAPMPGILICHSHHYPKTQGELQQMGMTWARQGSTVLVMDQLGHGERAQHPFRAAADFGAPFRLGRQDYFFRYNVGMQLELIGESLIGWMVGDLMRGVDVLVGRPGVDASRIILIGAVAGGGDPAAIAAALDRRVAAVVPFGFGKARREPDGSQVNYAGSGSWESTRNLRLSARDGFAPWTILGAIAPRRLVYAHEFAWDAGHDPVWSRLQAIYGLYEVPDRLAVIHGSGSVRGHSPRDTHCNNVGAIHRRELYPILERWFGMPVPRQDHDHQHAVEQLHCRTPDAAGGSEPQPLHRWAGELGRARSAAARQQLARLDASARHARLRSDVERLLGDVRPATGWRTTELSHGKSGGAATARIVL
jgi:dienelactone hydrolase